MKTLDKNLISHAYYCGLPAQFNLKLKVLQYAQGEISAEEYAEFYASASFANQLFADIMISEIESGLVEQVSA